MPADKTAALLRRVRSTAPVELRRRLIVRELLRQLRDVRHSIASVDLGAIRLAVVDIAGGCGIDAACRLGR